MSLAFLEAVGAERAGIASGVLQTSRQLGGVVGVALFGSLVAQAGLVRGMHQGQAIAAAAMLIGCALTPRFVSPHTLRPRDEKRGAALSKLRENQYHALR
jgi:DHA2 family methylenomycin A resistance protein-like MFS transporter